MYSTLNNPKKPRIRVIPVFRKMSHQQSQLMRVPKQEIEMPPGGGRRFPQPPPQQPMRRSGRSLAPPTASVAIEEVPNHEFVDNLNSSGGGQRQFDEEKLPVFLVKLWNIVEDPNLQTIVHWDESGASFHIADPFSFSKNVLPHFFKHNNMNSLIRQLNMYGFRKMTPLSQGGLTRTESDQDHLEFSHPCFIQNRPDLMQQIKRKQTTRNTDNEQNLEVVMSEMRAMRDKAKSMEAKMSSLTKENREIWEQMTAMRQTHARQQQYFKKLLHFLVSVMQPGLSKRVAKRGVLEIDFGAPGASGAPPGAKRGGARASEESPYKDVCDLLESLQRESQEPNFRRFSSGNHQDNGPLISEVTDEFRGGADMFQDAFERYQSSASPDPIISQPGSSGNLKEHYMGSGALTTENVHRPGKRSFGGGAKSSAIPEKRQMRSFEAPQQQAPPTFAHQDNQIMRLEHPETQDTHQDLYSPTLNLSPSLDRQISHEIQNYLQGYDSSLDNFRDLVHNSNWENFGDNLPEDEDFDAHGALGAPGANRLALEGAPDGYEYEDSVADLLDPLLGEHNGGEATGFEVGDSNYSPLGDEELFPRSPVLRTPSPSNLA